MTEREAHLIDILVAEPGLTGREIRQRSKEQTKWWSRKRLRGAGVYILLADMEERGLVRREIAKPVVPYEGHSLVIQQHRFWSCHFPTAKII